MKLRQKSNHPNMIDLKTINLLLLNQLLLPRKKMRNQGKYRCKNLKLLFLLRETMI
jgi:hypothetical protein